MDRVAEHTFHDTVPVSPATSQAGPSSRKAGLAATGGIFGAIAASSCCVLPLLFVSLGVSGAWIGNLTALAPYQPYFIVLTVALLGYGYWLVYRPKTACAEGEACARPGSNRLAKIGLWTASVLVIAAVAFPYVALQFL